jgi:hypothetical protein
MQVLLSDYCFISEKDSTLDHINSRRAVEDRITVDSMNECAALTKGVFIASNAQLLLNRDVIEEYPDMTINPDFKSINYDSSDGCNYLGPYGVVDSIDQLLEISKVMIEDQNRNFIFTAFEIRKEDQPESGGWRWHKWGAYYGHHDSQCEYLYDDADIESVYCYHIYEVLDQEFIKLKNFVEILSLLPQNGTHIVESESVSICTNFKITDNVQKLDDVLVPENLDTRKIELHHSITGFALSIFDHGDFDGNSFFLKYGVLSPFDFQVGKSLTVEDIVTGEKKDIIISDVRSNTYWLSVHDENGNKYPVVVPEHAEHTLKYKFSK